MRSSYSDAVKNQSSTEFNNSPVQTLDSSTNKKKLLRSSTYGSLQKNEIPFQERYLIFFFVSVFKSCKKNKILRQTHTTFYISLPFFFFKQVNWKYMGSSYFPPKEMEIAFFDQLLWDSVVLKVFMTKLEIIA